MTRAQTGKQQLDALGVDYDTFIGYIAQALGRMDDKGESPAEAAAAVTGGNRELDALIVRCLQGASWASLMR